MLEILRDSIWQFIGAILALMAIILVWMQRQRKALSYNIISNTSLVDIKEEIKGKLEVFFDGKPVENIYLIIIKFINTGNLPIKSVDYESPINMNFGKDARVLASEIIETDPDSLEASVNIEGTKVLLMPILLNQKDSITIKVLVNQFDNQITIGGRIIGVKKILKFTERKYASFFIGNIIGCIIVLIIFILVKYLEDAFSVALALSLVFSISIYLIISKSKHFQTFK